MATNKVRAVFATRPEDKPTCPSNAFNAELEHENEEELYNPIPVDKYINGDVKSYVAPGSSYFLQAERKWVKHNGFLTVPRNIRRSAIHFESEDEWALYQKAKEKPPPSGGAEFINIPEDRPSVTPISRLLPFKNKAWTKPWMGSGFYVPTTDRWHREHTGPAFTSDSYLFYNEEDWQKFQYQVENPKLQI